LRDEDGRTALEKARERSDESHQQVIQILESPSDYMMMAKKKRATSENLGGQELMDTCSRKETEEDEDEDMIDPLITRRIIQQLIPIFCSVFNVSFFISNKRINMYF
jgi:E3 ubiquitin-protein ligase HECTD1